MEKLLNNLRPSTFAASYSPLTTLKLKAFPTFAENLAYLRQNAHNPQVLWAVHHAALEQKAADREIAAIKAIFPDIPKSFLDEFFGPIPQSSRFKALYDQGTRAQFVQALKRYQALGTLPAGFGSQNAPKAYHAQRGIFAPSQRSSAKQANPMAAQIRTNSEATIRLLHGQHVTLKESTINGRSTLAIGNGF